MHVHLYAFPAPTFAVTGTATDSLGDPIPRALVMFTSEPDSSEVFMAVTDSLGYYEIADLPVMVAGNIPEPFSLDQNYPNPFNPATTIPFTLDTHGHVSLTVYNITGQRITTLVDGYQNIGAHSVVWDGTDDLGRHVSAGVYLYRLTVQGRSLAQKMLLLDGGTAGGASAPVYTQSPKRTAETTQTLYSVTVERFPYEKQLLEHVDVTETTTFDFTLQDAGLMVPIPGGTFQMGDEVGDLAIYCRPVHTVTVSSFDMCKYEITNEQYCAYLNAALESGNIKIIDDDVYGATGTWIDQRYLDIGYEIIQDNYCWIFLENDRFLVVSGYENWPVIAVTWYGAKEFALYYGFDLATEAEWEYACRGGMQYLYGTNDGTLNSDNANFDSNIGHPIVVGSYPANPFGLFDMTGNVWEWCHDRYQGYTTESTENPTGSETSPARAMRGCGWPGDTEDCRAANRLHYDPSYRTSNLGFRIVHRTGGVVY